MNFKSFLSATFILTVPVVSFSQNLKTEYDSSKAYIQKNNFAGALPWLEKAKTTVKANPGDTANYLEITRLMAFCYAKLGKNAEAETYFIETADLYAKMPSKRQQYVVALTNIGTFYYNQKKPKEALGYFQRASEVKNQLSGESNQEYLAILNNIGSCYIALKQYFEAENTYIKLVKLREEVLGGNHPEYIQACNSLSNLYKTMNRYDKAVQLYLEILEAVKANKGEKSKEFALAASNVANSYKELSQVTQAELYYKLSHDAYLQSVGEKNSEYALALENLAGIYSLSGKYEAAEPLYLKAQNILKELSGEISAEYAELLGNMANYYSETGKYDLSEINYKQAIEINRQVVGEKHPKTAAMYDNLGVLYKSMGRYEQAEPTLKKAQRYRKESIGEKHPDYAASLNNLAGLYENMGRFAEAEPLYKQSADIFKSTIGEKNPDYASVLNNLAGVYESLKKYTLAEPLYTQALQITKDVFGETHPSYATTLNNLALLQESLGKKEAAEKLYKQNIEATRTSLGERHPNYATSLNNYATLLENMGRYTEAEKYFLQSLAIRKEALGERHPAYTTTLYDLAKYYTAVKNYTQADLYWDKALSNYLYQIDAYFPSMSEKEKGKFYQIISPKFEQYNSYALLRYSQSPSVLAKMYDNQLATKALLLNATTKVKQRILGSNDFILIEKYKNWNTQKEILAKATNLSKEEIKAQGINIEEMNNAVNELEKELTASSEIFRSANENKTATWLDIQKKLKPEEAALELIRFTKYRFDSAGVYTLDSVFYAALIITPVTKNNPELVVLKNGTELEKQYLKYYRNAIKRQLEDEFSYKQYWSKIKAAIPGIKKIYFSPDGVYNMVNLNTLKNLQTQGFVSDEVDVRIVTNTKDLMAINTQQNSNKKITLLGSPDFAYTTQNLANTVKGITPEQASFIERAGVGVLTPLPGTKIEVEKISGMLSSNQWDTELYTEQNATEENIKKQDNPKVLHVATHGFFEQDGTDTKKNNKKEEDKAEENPLLKSGLMLAGASLSVLKRKSEGTNVEINTKSREDGILTAYEAMNLNLEKTDLVILSACETGLGEVKNGEGVYGLQRAFNVAGAKAIIISLWTVNDEATQKLMTTFYQEWIKTNNKRQAFKNAQLALRKTFPQPYYWGAFVMIGE